MVEMYTWEYEDNFPIGYQCPPRDATPRNIDLYRFTKYNPIQDIDFQPMVITNPTTKNKNKNNPKSLCQSCGLSSFPSIESAKDFYVNSTKGTPALKEKFKYIVKGNITIDSGVVMNTPSLNSKEHLTWWIKKDKTGMNSFNQVYTY